MSTNQHKWFRKRSAEDKLEDLSDHDLDDAQDDSVWKVKTLDEILQEKRKRLEKEDGDKEEEPAIEREVSEPASRSSSVAASPTAVKQERPSPSPAEVIYQLSPGQHSYSSLSSGGATPSSSKQLATQEVGKVTSREGKRRRQTEEEEGEIVSDGSDHEDQTKSRGSRHASVSDVEMKSQVSTEEGKKDESDKAESEEESSDDESSESESEDEEVVQTGDKPNQKVGQEKEKDEQQTESDDSKESDSESEDESEDTSSEEEATQRAEPATNKDERGKEENKKVNDNEAGKDGDGDDGSDDDEEEEEEESESEDESSEESESENEQPGKQPVVRESSKVVEHLDEEETEDIHKELLQVTESQKQKERDKKQRKYDTDKPRRDRSHDYDDHIQKSKEYSRASDSRRYGPRDKHHIEDQRGWKERPSQEQSYDKKDTRHREKTNERSSSSRKLMEKSRSKESISARDQPKEKYSTATRDVPPKSSKRDSGKWKSPRESEYSRKVTKSTENQKKESKESRDYRRGPREDKKRRQVEKSRETEKPVKTERVPGRKEGQSSILTEQERKQFSQEVVDLESEGGSSTEENVPSPPPTGADYRSDSEMHSDKEEEREPEKPKLPLYLPAIRGCRNVEEFQWLNRIEEGTYGVVYRAKDKRTGEIVALKRLKMEKEKEGFPITSLREINTLLKSQHPNIVTVREIVVGSNMDKIYIVMDYVEHDLKALMEHMPNPFLAGEVKTLMIQLLRAVAHLHDNWILHRDLKTSNLLLSNKGILKVGDFGLAREYGSPLRHYTPIVVTLWYRAPELLLGVKEYSTPIDLWSVGCIFAELLTMKPLFPGRSEIDQINKIFKELGTPSDKIWPGPPSYSELPAVKKMTFTEYPYNNLRNKFGAYLTDKGFDMLNRFLTYDPQKRITAEQALKHGFFTESPMPVDPSMFPSWPAKSELTKRPKRKDYEHSPQAPEGGASFAKLGDDDSGGFHIATLKKGSSHVTAGFSLKF